MPYTAGPEIDLLWMSEQPTIQIDDELLLRPFEVSDAATVKRAFDDPDIQRWHAFRVDDLDEAVAWIESTYTKWESRLSASWAIVDGSGMLGRCALHFFLAGQSAEVAYWILPESRRRGVATRAAIAATRWAHEVAGLHRVLLEHSALNDASRLVAQRAGFTPEGMARSAGRHADGWHDMHRHAHIATDALPD